MSDTSMSDTSGSHTSMSDTSHTFDSVEALVLDLLEWIGPAPRPYDKVMEAWRTSCPRLPVWEEANARGFVHRHDVEGLGPCVSVTPAGREHLEHRRSHPEHRRQSALA
jgi:D-3-phosphoglycerate dehydrogenase / 2-oxoglutarate reductase